MKKNKLFLGMTIGIIIVILATILICNIQKIKAGRGGEKIDDWIYNRESYISGGNTAFSNNYINAICADLTTTPGVNEIGKEAYIGYSTGGAKDVNNFRKNIELNYFPISTDVTYEGIFYDYSFNTGKKNESTELFSPSYSYAISKDPISGKVEYYMTVGLNSNIKESDFKRKKLNLVLMLDISGSMSSYMDKYYYDKKSELNTKNKTKIEAAEQSINCLIDQLQDYDKFGIVLFDDGVYVGKEMNLVKNTDVEAIKNHILEIKAQGGTNYSAGYEKSTELFNEYLDENSNEYENRIIVITDAMPNLGDTSKEGLYSSIKKNSEDGINTTFIGVGVDFNTDLIESIGKVKGANYYSVHSSEEFKKRMGEQFDYMVTPLVYDLKLDFNSEYFNIEQIYGSDAVNKNTGNIMHVNTLFPSASNSEGEVKGGVILLKISPINSKVEFEKEAKLSVSYVDRNGKKYSNEQTVELKLDSSEEYYENAGIRKAIVLVRYIKLIKNWILYERTEGNKNFYITDETGLLDCYCTTEQVLYILGEHERQSVKLSVSNEYKNVFSQIKNYIEEEIKEIKDVTLEQEVKILDKLINY